MPYLYELELEPTAAAVRHARLRTREQLLHWGVPDLLEPAELLVTELTANATQHTGAPSRIRLALDAELSIEVTDSSPAPPAARDPSPDEPGGWGLTLVDATADQWGWSPAQVGKTVWAVLHVPAPVAP